jgi:ATP-dependent RNA helicase DDX31/DBP7
MNNSNLTTRKLAFLLLTLTCLLPIVASLILDDVTDYMILALVLVPTRELCLQVYGIAQQLVHRFHWIVPGYVMGGENRAKEKARLRKGISCSVKEFLHCSFI